MAVIKDVIDFKIKQNCPFIKFSEKKLNNAVVLSKCGPCTMNFIFIISNACSYTCNSNEFKPKLYNKHF